MESLASPPFLVPSTETLMVKFRNYAHCRVNKLTHTSLEPRDTQELTLPNLLFTQIWSQRWGASLFGLL